MLLTNLNINCLVSLAGKILEVYKLIILFVAKYKESLEDHQY